MTPVHGGSWGAKGSEAIIVYILYRIKNMNKKMFKLLKDNFSIPPKQYQTEVLSESIKKLDNEI